MLVPRTEGAITADAAGNVYLSGKSASGLPLSLNPGGEYTGGNFLLVMSPDLKRRLLCTRTCPGAGDAHALAVRTVAGKTRIVYAGSGASAEMAVQNPVQAAPADTGTAKDDPRDAFFAVIESP